MQTKYEDNEKFIALNCFSARRDRPLAGFSVLELTIVLGITLVLAAMAVPNLNSTFHNNKLRSAAIDFSGLLEQARFRSVQDSRYYSVYFLTGKSPRAFVDIYPQNSTGASGSGGTVFDSKDPDIGISTEINQQPQGAAPNTSNLVAQFLPASSPISPVDGSLSSSPITFSPF